MKGMTRVGPLVWARLLASWRLLAVLAFGILVASTLMAAAPVYTRVMNDLGLQESLRRQIGSATRMGLIAFDLRLGSEEAAQQRQRMEALASTEVGWLTASEARGAGLVDLTLARPGQPFRDDQFRTVAELYTVSDFSEKVQVIAGRLPQPTSDPSRIEVVMSSGAAEIARAKPGDRFVTGRTFDDCTRPPPSDDPAQARDAARFRCVPQAFATISAPFEVVGIVEQADARDPFWSATGFWFARPETPEEAGPTIPFLMPEQTFFEALPKVLPGVGTDFRLVSYADVSRLDSANIDDAKAAMARLEHAAEAQGFVSDMALAGALGSFTSRASFNQVALALLLLQVVGIAVYYVLLVSTLLAERRAEEIAMLRSRGATVLQVVTMSLLEAGALALGAVLVAPFIAAGVVALLGKTNTFESVSGGGLLEYRVVPMAFVYALGGAALAVLAVVIPSFFAARRGVVLFLRGTSRPGQPLLQRYYLDLALAGLAALALWELNQRGSVYDPRSVGGWSADPLLLASPLILIMAVGTLLFRFLPLVLRVLSRVLAATSGPGLTLGLWQLTRSPGRYTQLALLVVMAAAVGTFAATYGATTARSQEERALFQAGVDLRTTGLGKLEQATPPQVRAALNGIPGVEDSAAAYRGTMSLGPIRGFEDQVQVLAIDPAAASKLLWFRDDFADEDLGTLTRRLSGSPAGGAGLVLMAWRSLSPGLCWQLSCGSAINFRANVPRWSPLPLSSAPLRCYFSAPASLLFFSPKNSSRLI